MIISRLMPGEDLKEGIININSQNKIKSGIIVCIVGSLNSATLRMASKKIMTFNGPFEIVSAEGTIAENGIHVHIAISDEDGRVIGGHLKKGCIIKTTAEICVLKSYNHLNRVFDPVTGYRELVVENKK